MPANTERQKRILQILSAQYAVQVSELANIMGVSEVTVRRDLNQLADQAKVSRVHGGAILTPRELVLVPLQQRSVLNLESKRRIGRHAAQFVEDGDTVIIAGGTTTAELARHLVTKRNLMVITPALNIAYMFADAPDVTVLVTGGIMVGPEVTLAGYFGERTLRELRASKLFIGAGAFNPEAGVTSEHPSEIGISRAMLDATREHYLLVDHSKFDTVLTCQVCPAQELTCVITDDKAPSDAVAHLCEMGVQVFCV